MTTTQTERWQQAARRFSARGAVFAAPEPGREGRMERHVTRREPGEAQLALEMACAQRDILGRDVYLIDQDSGIEYGYARRDGSTALYLDALTR